MGHTYGLVGISIGFTITLMGAHTPHKKLDEPEIESTVPIMALQYTNHIPMRRDIHWLVGIFIWIIVALMGTWSP